MDKLNDKKKFAVFIILLLVSVVLPIIRSAHATDDYVEGLSCDTASINWGTVQAGLSYNHTVEFTNTGNLSLTLNYTTANFDPAGLNECMNVTWDYDDTPLEPEASLNVTFTLNIYENATSGNFSFDIIVSSGLVEIPSDYEIPTVEILTSDEVAAIAVLALIMAIAAFGIVMARRRSDSE